TDCQLALLLACHPQSSAPPAPTPLPSIGAAQCTSSHIESAMIQVSSAAAGASSPAGQGVSVDLSKPATATLKQGLLNGSNDYVNPTPQYDLADSLLSALRPSAWRFSGFGNAGYGGNIYKFVVTDYKYDTRFGTSVVVNLQ